MLIQERQINASCQKDWKILIEEMLDILTNKHMLVYYQNEVNPYILIR